MNGKEVIIKLIEEEISGITSEYRLCIDNTPVGNTEIEISETQFLKILHILDISPVRPTEKIEPINRQLIYY